MAEGGLQSSSESCSAKDETSFMLLIPEDNVVRRHSFHEVRREPNDVSANLDNRRRNSSFPESQFHKIRCSVNYGYDDQIVKVEEIDVEHRQRQQHHQQQEQRRHHSRHHHHHHHKHHHHHHRRKSSAIVDTNKLHHHHIKHNRRKSSAAVHKPDLLLPDHSNKIPGSLEKIITAEQKTKRKVMMAVLVVTGFIVVVSLILVAVTLHLSPTIDQIVRKENEDLWKKMSIASNAPKKEDNFTAATVTSPRRTTDLPP